MPQDFTFPLIVLSGMVGGFGMASIGLWIRMMQGLREGRQPLPLQPRTAATPNLLVTTLALAYALVTLGGHVAVSLQQSRAEPSLRVVQMACFVNVLILMLLLAMLAVPKVSRLSDFGITLRNWRRSAIDGALGFVASLLPVYSVQMLLLLVNRVLPFRTEESQHSFLQFLTSDADPTAVVWVAVAAVVLAPLAEELMFRVIIQGWLESRVKPVAAIAASAVLFSTIHGFPDAIGLMPLAVILGYVYHRTHSYPAVVVLHALFNAFSLSMVLLARPDQAAAATAMCLPSRLLAVLQWGL